MTRISKTLEQIVSQELTRNIIPIKTEQGILVGDVLIKNSGFLKNLYQKQNLVYQDIHLNITSIKLANILAHHTLTIEADKIYQADQEYGKWYTDSYLHRTNYESAVKKQLYDRADVLWARYRESQDRMLKAKKIVETLCAG